MNLVVAHVHVNIYNRNSSCETGNLCQAWDMWVIGNAGGSIISYVNIFTFILQCLFDVMPAAYNQLLELLIEWQIFSRISLDMSWKGNLENNVC